MYAVTAPVPGRVRAIADRLHPELHGFESVREEPSLTVKRLGEETDDGSTAATAGDRIARQVGRALEGAPAVAARVDRLECFEEPPVGPAPVVYLAVESPGLHRLHRRLVDRFGAVDGLEGSEYVPHVTLARGGDPDAARELAGRSVGPVEWTVGELAVVGHRRLPITRISLPA